MGLLDKVKNLFTDEEIIDEEEDNVTIREVKKEEKEIDDDTKEHKLPTFMREKIEKEESNIKPDFTLDKQSNVFESPKEISKVDISNEVVDEKNKFKFPIEFEESDFLETRSSRQNAIRAREEKKVTKEEKHVIKEELKPKETKVASLYKDKKTEKKEEKKFKATPIISPIYGVLEKNYKVDEVCQNDSENFDMQRPSRNVDFDTVRKKAYGSLADDIKENLMCENCEYLKEVKECHKKKKKDELMYDILDEDKDNNIDDISIGTASENYFDYGKEYTHPTINNSYENLDKNAEENDDNSSKGKKVVKEVPPVKSKINLLSTLKKSAGDEREDKKNEELTDDLFNLIDSMYDEGNENK